MEVGTSILLEICAVHKSLFGTKRTSSDVRSSVANGGKADITLKAHFGSD